MLVSLNEWQLIIKSSVYKSMLKFQYVENIHRAYDYGISTNIEEYLADNLIGRFWNTSNIN